MPRPRPRSPRFPPGGRKGRRSGQGGPGRAERAGRSERWGGVPPTRRGKRKRPWRGGGSRSAFPERGVLGAMSVPAFIDITEEDQVSAPGSHRARAGGAAPGRVGGRHPGPDLPRRARRERSANPSGLFPAEIEQTIRESWI